MRIFKKKNVDTFFERNILNSENFVVLRWKEYFKPNEINNSLVQQEKL